ncbi:hypothetical protein [Aridibaculum aurantiacum]|uniref:hypothetical protein n=1 Tax=Aridibaculum aurantiacum TaxID=2810307 RepID=UPI001A95F602|nr:hypothetical protein [Aridibaculum aurantiacum]
MKYLKGILLICFFAVVSISAYSQASTYNSEADDDKDTTAQLVQINTITPRKKGVYKTYEEYRDNSPSIEAEFTVKPLYISRNNPLVAEADVSFIGKRPKKIWGISDGENVYVRVILGNFFQNHYFRLQCNGPVPYIYLVENPVFVPGGLGLAVAATVAATSAALPPFVTLSIVREETNYMKPVLMATNSRVKRYLKEYPELLEAYEKEARHNKATKAKYLTEYNNRKIENK